MDIRFSVGTAVTADGRRPIRSLPESVSHLALDQDGPCVTEHRSPN